MLAAGITLLMFDLLIAATLWRKGVLHEQGTFRVHELLLAMWPTALAVGVLTAAAAARWPSLGARVNPTTAFVLPAVTAALALPLTIHLVFFAIERGPLGVRSFEDWALMSMAITGIAHIWFAVCVGKRAAQLIRGHEDLALRVRTIYWSTILVSCVPGILALGIPPLVVAVTGLPILPLLHLMKRYARPERENDDAALPFARVIA